MTETRGQWRLNAEPEGVKEIKRQTVIHSEERVNHDISIRSAMLFAEKMTALSVILTPLQRARAQLGQSVFFKEKKKKTPPIY